MTMPLRLHPGRITRLHCQPTRVAKDAFQREVTEDELEQAAGSSLSALVGSAKQTEDAPKEESVIFVELEVGPRRFHGVLAACPAQVSDDVEMVVDGQLILGLALPQKRLIALRPGCVRGRRAQIKSSLRHWGLMCLIGCPLIAGMVYGLNAMSSAVLPWSLSGSAIFALLAAIVVQRHYHNRRRWSCRLTEDILATLGQAKPTEIDLRRLSKARDSSDFGSGYGTSFFSY
jgi:hypothetical protein